MKSATLLLLSLVAVATNIVYAHEGHHDENPYDAHGNNVPDVDFEAIEKTVRESLGTYVPLKVENAILYEPFDHDLEWTSLWKSSRAKKIVNGVEDESLLAYRGELVVEAPIAWPGSKGDQGLVFKTANAHHAISRVFKEPLDPKGKPLVIQYETKFQKPWECGGAYIKLLDYDKSFNPDNFSDRTPYTIMFGPDKCGSSKTVHFIFKRKNQNTGEIEDHMLDSPPEGKYDKKSTLYTLIVMPDNTFKILVNNEVAREGTLHDDFEPPVNPPKEVDDPKDTKPADWIDDPMMLDPEAKKPDDWDEDAPTFIEDESAIMPEDWLESESYMVLDTSIKQPDLWNDAEDGKWVPPKIPNPKCEQVSGCGKWTRPMKKNPNFKGKWTPPMIDNPAYKGEWKPRQVPNPDYYEDKNPAEFNKIGAIGFEIWTVQSDLMIDNIYVGNSVDEARRLAEKLWKPKFEAERRYEDAIQKQLEKSSEPEKPSVAMTYIQQATDIVKRFYKDFTLDLDDFLQQATSDPMAAFKSSPQVVVTLAAIVFSLMFPFIMLGTMAGTSPSKETQAAAQPKKPSTRASPNRKKQEPPAESEDDKSSVASSPGKHSETRASPRKGTRTKKSE